MEARLGSVFKSEDDYEIVEKFKGKALENKGYTPLFDYFKHFKNKKAFRVLCDTYVTEDSGTGCVHQVNITNLHYFLQKYASKEHKYFPNKVGIYILTL